MENQIRNYRKLKSNKTEERKRCKRSDIRGRARAIQSVRHKRIKQVWPNVGES